MDKRLERVINYFREEITNVANALAEVVVLVPLLQPKVPQLVMILILVVLIEERKRISIIQKRLHPSITAC